MKQQHIPGSNKIFNQIAQELTKEKNEEVTREIKELRKRLIEFVIIPNDVRDILLARIPLQEIL